MEIEPGDSKIADTCTRTFHLFSQDRFLSILILCSKGIKLHIFVFLAGDFALAKAFRANQRAHAVYVMSHQRRCKFMTFNKVALTPMKRHNVSSTSHHRR